MSEGEVAERYRVGYALQPDKVESFIKPTLLIHAKQHGIDLVQIDPSSPIQQNAPFHCIIHKLHTQQWKNDLQQYSTKYPNTVIIDPPEMVDRLNKRVSMLDSVTHLPISLENATLGVPRQVVVNEPKADKIHELGLRFPMIAKPLEADSHQLFLVFDDEGLNALTAPTVLQEFVYHGGVVFKIYVAGKCVKCVKRKSLGDISEETLRTLKGALPFSRISNLGVQDEGGAVEEAAMPPQCLVGELGTALREALGLNLFNVDLIRDSKDPTRYLVIDINYFPGYAKLPYYESFITDFLLDVVRTKTSYLSYNSEET